MHIVAFGLNHNTAPVEVRERAFVASGDVAGLLEELKAGGLREAVVLSTCNRTEIYFPCEEISEGFSLLTGILASYFSLDPAWLEGYTYLLSDTQAFHHLFAVASGLDSMVVGEPQILGQVKEAYRIAAQNNATDLYLNKIFHRAFHVAKRIRTETRIGYNPVSISSMAVELARRIFGDLPKKKILVIGAGEMCEVALRHFRKEGLEEIAITNRTFQAAERLGREIMGTAHPFENIPELMTRVDMVLTSTGAEEPILRRDMVVAAMKRRKNRPLFLIDIAVPRDVDPLVNDLDNVYLYDIDDLKDLSQKHLSDRHRESEKASAIVGEEVEKFGKWLERLDVNPLISQIVGAVEEMRLREVRRSLQRMRGLSDGTEHHIDALTKAIVAKILHPHLELIREDGGPAVAELMRRLFRIEDRTENEEDMDSGDEGK